MDKKLTLRVDGTVIDLAKKYAEDNHESVSGLVERYLKTLTLDSDRSILDTSKIVGELSGVISIPEGYDEKQDYRSSKVNGYDA